MDPHSPPRREDPSHDILQSRPRGLDSLLRPQSAAVIGATERAGSVGRAVLSNLSQASFKGPVYAVNPKYTRILGRESFASIKNIPNPPDLAIIATPAATVPALIEECLEAGVKSAVILSAGFKEKGPEGAQLEEKITAKVKDTGFRILGPNCLGLLNPHWGLNASFASQTVLPGSVAFLSQSGALVTAILDWSLESRVGFSTFVSTGSMMDVGWGDLIYSLGDDPHTQSILIYMESVGDAGSFISAAREVALTKPIILIKAGRSEAASKAAVSHTGALAGSDAVLKAALKRCGVLSVDRIQDLFQMAEVLAKQPRPKGNRMAILTNAGGPGVLATDALVEGRGELAELSAKTLQALDQLLPPHWSRGNPVDVLGDADPTRYQKAVEIALKDENSDGLLAILTPQDMTDPAKTAELLQPFGSGSGKPFLTSLMGGLQMGTLRDGLSRAGIPSFSYPDDAVRIFNYMWRYSHNLAGLYETASFEEEEDFGEKARKEVSFLLEEAMAQGRTLLSEIESKKILSLYGLPVILPSLAKTGDEACGAAEKIGFPVVLKLHSLTVTHKSDVGGVRLNLGSEAEVREAFQDIENSVREKTGEGHFQGVTVQPMEKSEGLELILGSSQDPQFGPVLLFGTGGKFVEVYKDSSLGLPPLTTTLARRLMEPTKIYGALKGVRGMAPADLGALERLLVRFSRLVVEQPAIREIDINPLLVSGLKILALDARVVLNDPKSDKSSWPKPAIQPYPVQYVKSFTLGNGSEATLRPIRPEDETLMEKFHEALSDQTVHMRYFQPLSLTQRVGHDRLVRLCFLDYRREIALVADQKDPAGNGRRLLAIGRLSRTRSGDEMEFSMVVADPYQRLGLGAELLRRLVEIGRAEGYRRIIGHILPENGPMQGIARKLGFKINPSGDPALLEAAIDL